MNSYYLYLVLESEKDVDRIIMFLASSNNIGISFIKDNNSKDNVRLTTKNVIHCVVNSPLSLDSTEIKLYNFCKKFNIYYNLMLLTNGDTALSIKILNKSKKKMPSYLKVVK